MVYFLTICAINWQISPMRNVLWVSPIAMTIEKYPKLIKFIT